jgi:hypothetical protein
MVSTRRREEGFANTKERGEKDKTYGRTKWKHTHRPDHSPTRPSRIPPLIIPSHRDIPFPDGAAQCIISSCDQSFWRQSFEYPNLVQTTRARHLCNPSYTPARTISPPQRLLVSASERSYCRHNGYISRLFIPALAHPPQPQTVSMPPSWSFLTYSTART